MAEIRCVALAALVALGVLATACARTDPAEEARAAVTAFVEAGKRGDRETILDLLSVTDRQQAGDVDWTPLIAPNPELEYWVQGAIVDGELASVRLELEEAGESHGLDVQLVREEGEWRVAQERTLDRLSEAIAEEIYRELRGALDSER